MSKKERLNKYGEFLKSGKYSDFKIIVKNTTFSVHKSVLVGYEYIQAILDNKSYEETDETCFVHRILHPNSYEMKRSVKLDAKMHVLVAANKVFSSVLVQYLSKALMDYLYFCLYILEGLKKDAKNISFLNLEKTTLFVCYY